MFELFVFSALVVASASVSTDHGSDVVSRVFLTSCTIGLRGLQCAVAHRILRSVSCVCATLRVLIVIWWLHSVRKMLHPSGHGCYYFIDFLCW